jgi:group I intron endonuclease
MTANFDYCGVYEIFNKITGDRYIGSSRNIRSRFNGHKGLLRSNKHHSKKLQLAFNHYKESAFEFRLISKCELALQFILEQFYLDSMLPFYNTAISVESPMKYRTHTVEVRKNMIGRKTWNKGVPRTEEEKAYMSYKRKLAASKQTPEQKEKYRKRTTEYLKTYKPFKGKKHTEERKRLIRKGFTDRHGKIICNETGKIYEAQADAAKDLGIRQGHISEHLKGKRKTASKYTFRPFTESI